MKKLIFILLFLPLLLLAQTPQEFKYQAVLRGANGDLLVNQVVSLKTSILSVSAVGTVEYEETHSLGTNGYGVASINIGSGAVLSGSFANIDWSSNTYYLKTELDITGGSSFQFMGISQILSVPYALHAESASTSLDDNDKDSTNEIQQLSIANDTVKLSDGGEVYLGSYLDNTDQQTLSLQGNQLVISNGNSVSLTGTVDLDADPSNELQVLSLSNDTLYLSNGNYVVLPPDNDGDPVNEIQNLSITGSDVSISGANTISLPANNDNDSSNELQNLTLSGGDLTISNGNTVTLPPDGDSDATNEIQVLSLSNDTLYLTNGGYAVLPQEIDADITNEIQALSLSNDTLYLTDGGFAVLPEELDSDTTNEIQTLSYNNDTLSISNGNQVTINTSSFDFIYPDGKSGITPINLFSGDTSNSSQIIIPQSTWPFLEAQYQRQFTVPSGKNLYITSVTNQAAYGGTNFGSVQIDNKIIHRTFSNSEYGDKAYPDLSLPIIVGESQVVKIDPTLKSHNNDYIVQRTSINGFLVDKKINPITISLLTPSDSYTVPSSKILVILNAYSTSGYVKLNGNAYLFHGGYNSMSYSSSNGYYTENRITSPIFIDENDIITGTININGYLMDK